MSKIALWLVPALAAASISAAGSVAQAQSYPIADRVADRVIAKYQNSSCEQLAAAKAAPPSAMQQQALQTLKQDPSMRTYFINKVAAAVANKLFECGMLP